MRKLKIEKSSKKKGLILAVVADEFEAKQVIGLAKSERTIIFCLSLEAEFYLKKTLGTYTNPIYGFMIGANTISAYDYIPINFGIAYSFLGDEYSQFIRDRYAYFLTELDRSLDLANKIIKRYKPSKIIIGDLVYYKGSSVMDGNLKKDAFSLLAKHYKIPHYFLNRQIEKRTFVEIIGKIIRFARLLKRQTVKKSCDLMIVATPRHVIQMGPLIKQISKKVSVTIITYSVSVEVKRRLDKLGIIYFEKERLLDNQIRKALKNKGAELLNQKIWNSFVLPKYSKNVEVTGFVRKKLRRIFYEEMEEIIGDYLTAQKMFSKSLPKLLFTTTDPDPKALTYINAAKKAGVDTLSIQHGISFPIDPPSQTPESKYFVTWSELSLKSIKKNPSFRNKTILIGQSPFHEMSKSLMVQRKKGSRKILFLVAIDILDSTIKSYYLKKLFQELDKFHGDFEIVIRTHPFQNRRNLEALVENGKIKATFDKNINLNDSIMVSDLVIFENTTAGLDAMLTGSPAIYFNPYSGQDFFQVGSTNAAVTIFSQKDIKEKLGRFLSNPSQWADYSKKGKIFAKEYLGLDSNGKSNRLVEIILQKVRRN